MRSLGLKTSANSRFGWRLMPASYLQTSTRLEYCFLERRLMEICCIIEPKANRFPAIKLSNLQVFVWQVHL